MNSTNERRSPNEISAEFRRLRQPRQSARQLSFRGFGSSRRPAQTTSPEAPSTGPSRRRVNRARPRQEARLAPGTLSPVEQMTILRGHDHLLNPSERKWVARIERTVKDRGADCYLSERQRTVIADIFDRFRARIGR